VKTTFNTAESSRTRAVETGYRVLPGIGDLVIQAWGPTRLRCMEAAARGMLDPAVELAPGPVRAVERLVPAGDDRRMLADVLRAVLDVRRSVGPVGGAELSSTPGGDLRLRLRVGATPERRCRPPRRVSPQWVSVMRTARGWRCEATVDR
jgi:SHS2 domain-containing protein